MWGKVCVGEGGSINWERKYLRKYYQSAERSKHQKPLIQSQKCQLFIYLFFPIMVQAEAQ